MIQALRKSFVLYFCSPFLCKTFYIFILWFIVEGRSMTYGCLHILPLVSCGFLMLCIFAVYKVRRFAQNSTENIEAPIGGSSIEGMKLIFSSKLLQQIALMTVMSVLIGGIFYYLQGSFVKEFYTDRDVRTSVFANINTLTNMFTLFFQLILTPFFLQKFIFNNHHSDSRTAG